MASKRPQPHGEHGTSSLSVTVVPDAATGPLLGLRGQGLPDQMMIDTSSGD